MLTRDLDFCTCFHAAVSHVNGDGRCRDDDSYGLPCGCPSFEHDPNLDEKALGPDDDWDPSNPDGEAAPPVWRSGRIEEC